MPDQNAMTASFRGTIQLVHILFTVQVFLFIEQNLTLTGLVEVLLPRKCQRISWGRFRGTYCGTHTSPTDLSSLWEIIYSRFACDYDFRNLGIWTLFSPATQEGPDGSKNSWPRLPRTEKIKRQIEHTDRIKYELGDNYKIMHLIN